MRILSYNFLLFIIVGLWRPDEWSSNCSKLLYTLYSFFIVYLIAFLMSTMFLNIIFVVDSIEDFAATSLMSISVMSTFSKPITVLARRSRIMNLLQILQEEPCKARNEEENEIQKKLDRTIRFYSISYSLLATVSLTGATAGAFLEILQGQLPLRVWVPYDCTNSLVFWFTSLQEVMALIFGTFINVAAETSVLGFCLQICAQFDILKHRLWNIMRYNKRTKSPMNDATKKTSILSKHVCHHLCIIRLCKMINEIFSEVFFIQFFTSILVLCSCVYHLASHMTIEDFATLVVFTFCMFVQVFIYCWAGNEVMIKSVELGEVIYQMDWIFMTISDRKNLLMIMKRSTRPIKFTSSFLVTMSLDSYGNLLKASYSAFNLLQQS